MKKDVKAEYDLVIVGSGIAGLSFALKVAEAGYRVAIFTKKDKAESNTNYAQGGIAAVTSAGDDLDKHVEDTLEAGDGLDPEIVGRFYGTAPLVSRILRKWEFFPVSMMGVFLWGKKVVTERRVLHVKDVTGKAIEDALLANIAKQGVTCSSTILPSIWSLPKSLKLGVKVDGDDDRILGIYFRCQS